MPDPSVDAREQRWTVLGGYDGARHAIFVRGTHLEPNDCVEVVPASRLAEAERERKRVVDLAEDCFERWQSAVNDAEVLRARAGHLAPLLGLLHERDDWRRRFGELQEALETIEQIASVEAGEQVREQGLRESLRAIRGVAAAARARDDESETTR